MRRILACLGSVVFAGCIPASSSIQPSEALADPADSVSFGACAPVRYRAIEPGELKKRVVRLPPRPISFQVSPSFTSKPAEKAASRRIVGQLRGAKREILECIEDGLLENRSTHIRVSALVHRNGTRISSFRGVADSGQRRCAERVVRAKVDAKLSAPSQAFLHFSIRVGPRPKTPKLEQPTRPRGTVEILSSSDRTTESMELGGMMALHKQPLVTCLKQGAARGSGRAVATLTIENREVAMAEVELEKADELSTCFARTLSGAKVNIEENGSFRCAFAYGGSAKKPIDLVLEVKDESLWLGNREPTPIVTSQLPPAGALYAELLEIRFAEVRPSPAPAIIVIDPEVRGESLVAVAKAATAADIEVVGIRIAPVENPTSERADIPSPRLGRFSSRVAKLTAIASSAEGKESIWLGVSKEDGELIAATDHVAIRRALNTLSKRPGIAERTDAVLGLAPEQTISSMSPVIKNSR